MPDDIPLRPVPVFERLPRWLEAWERSGRLVLLLDFDGTLSPIVPRPEAAAILPAARDSLLRLLGCETVDVAVVSGRGLADARSRVGLAEIAYAGNHGMEIEGADFRQIHEEAAAARPALEEVVRELRPKILPISGALLEDKGLTLSIHYRLVDPQEVEQIRTLVRAAVGDRSDLRVTEGKKVLEVRPAVKWDKGRAVRFLLEQLRPAAGTPVLYVGDDTTDEDAFRALAEWEGGTGEGIIVADPLPERTAATAFLRDPEEVARLLERLVEAT